MSSADDWVWSKRPRRTKTRRVEAADAREPPPVWWDDEFAEPRFDWWTYQPAEPAPEPPGRRRVLRAYVAGAASLLAAEALVVAVVALPPVAAVGGTAVPQPVAAPAPPQPPPVPDPAPAPSPAPTPASVELPRPESPRPPPPGQRPGTIRLPHGGTAVLVRKEVVGPTSILPVPENLGEATWWGAGLDAPGGASVFAGHVNWNGREGPFSELWTTRVNEPVTVLDTARREYRYRVTQVFTLHKDELPQRADDLFSQQGPHRIVLVTCGGRWLGGSAGYAENRVVIAEPAD